jgi:hypothetical protein
MLLALRSMMSKVSACAETAKEQKHNTIKANRAIIAPNLGIKSGPAKRKFQHNKTCKGLICL